MHVMINVGKTHFINSFSLFSMVQAGWRTYDDKNATITLTEDLCALNMVLILNL